MHLGYFIFVLDIYIFMWVIRYLSITYSWVENNSSLSITHVARSTEPHLAHFFILIRREHKNMSLSFPGTVSLCCFSHIVDRPVRNIKLDQNLVPTGISSGRQFSTIFAKGVSMSGLKGTFYLIYWPTIRIERMDWQEGRTYQQNRQVHNNTTPD